jgi:cytoskeleton protein RodZ
MESVGVKLRNERLRQGLSLDALSAKTRIPVKSLEAIEDDHHSQISPLFFYKSFVRQFAERLGMDYADLAPAVEEVMHGAQPITHHANADPMLPKIAPLQPLRPKKYRWLFSMVAFITVLCACSGLYAMWQDSKGGVPGTVPTVDQRTTESHTRVSELRSSPGQDTASTPQAR